MNFLEAVTQHLSSCCEHVCAHEHVCARGAAIYNAFNFSGPVLLGKIVTFLQTSDFYQKASKRGSLVRALHTPEDNLVMSGYGAYLTCMLSSALQFHVGNGSEHWCVVGRSLLEWTFPRRPMWGRRICLRCSSSCFRSLAQLHWFIPIDWRFKSRSSCALSLQQQYTRRPCASVQGVLYVHPMAEVLCNAAYEGVPCCSHVFT